MTTGNPGLFHKTHSLEEALRGSLKNNLPRENALPLKDVLLPALQELINQTQTDGLDPRENFQAMQNALEDWKRCLNELQSIADSWYAFTQLQSRFSEGWWADQFASLAKIFHQDAQAGAAAWLELFARALVEWDLPGCARLTEEAYPFPGSLSFIPNVPQRDRGP